MKLELHRVEQDQEIPKGRENRRTRGSLFVDGNLQCHILEDEVRPVKIMERTAIPAGTYQVVMVPSPKFKRVMPRLLDVPGFTGILIHSGHDEHDTWGCLLTAGGFDKDGDIIAGSSRPAFVALFDRLAAAWDRNERIDITITNDFMEA